MRLAAFAIFLFFHLFCGSESLHAGVQHNRSSYASSSHASPHHASKSRHLKFTNTDQGVFVIGDTDLDLDEEHLSGDDHNDTGSNELFIRQHGLLAKWYLSFFPLLILSDQHKHLKPSTSFCGNSSPIYITQRVLRIWAILHQSSISELWFSQAGRLNKSFRQYNPGLSPNNWWIFTAKGISEFQPFNRLISIAYHE